MLMQDYILQQAQLRLRLQRRGTLFLIMGLLLWVLGMASLYVLPMPFLVFIAMLCIVYGFFSRFWALIVGSRNIYCPACYKRQLDCLKYNWAFSIMKTSIVDPITLDDCYKGCSSCGLVLTSEVEESEEKVVATKDGRSVANAISTLLYALFCFAMASVFFMYFQSDGNDFPLSYVFGLLFVLAGLLGLRNMRCYL